MRTAIAPSFSLGPFRVEPALNRVSSPSSSRRVTPKAMEVLELLASRPGETVTRDTFLDAVWSDVSVGEEVLTRAIADLRKVLETKDTSEPVAVARSTREDREPALSPDGQQLGGLVVDPARDGVLVTQAVRGESDLLIAALGTVWAQGGHER